MSNMGNGAAKSRYSRRIGVRVDEETWRRIVERARQEDRPASRVVREALLRGLKKMED